MATVYESIENERISSLIFPKSDVLNRNEAIQQRFNELKMALTFGNLDYFKIKIYFEDNQSKKVVEAKVKETKVVEVTQPEVSVSAKIEEVKPKPIEPVKNLGNTYAPDEDGVTRTKIEKLTGPVVLGKIE